MIFGIKEKSIILITYNVFLAVAINTPFLLIYIYIYIYAFSRRFYPKRLTLHSSYSFYILSALAFPGFPWHL